MRQSTRLKNSEASLKLKDETYLSTFADEECEDEPVNADYFDLEEKIIRSPPKKTGKRGRPRKSAPKITEPVDETFQELNESDSEDSIMKKSFSSKSPKKTAAKKKIRRTGGYVPPLESFPGIQGNLLSSWNEWKLFFEEENSNIKRKNRRFKTMMVNNDEVCDVEGILSSSFKVVTVDEKREKTSLNISFNGESTNLIENASIIEGKFGNFNTGQSIVSTCFCECRECKVSSDKIFLYTVCSNLITIISAELSKKDGIKSLRSTGHILPPHTEQFKNLCAVGSILSISTEISHYFLDCSSLHNNGNRISLENGPKILSESSDYITCHSWKGKYIAVGTFSGFVHVFNTSLKEVFQISVKSDSAIHSLDWRDDCTFIVGGSFSKVFSINLRDPFIIETEVSTLATLPKVTWSRSLNSILFSDSENHVRRLEKSSGYTSRLHQPIGTFDSMVIDMRTSSLHNITASACASGSIHLAWIPEELGQGVEFEKRIFTVKKVENEAFELILDPEYVAFQVHDAIKLYPTQQACTSVAWCPNLNFPGLLAGGYRNGLLVLIATDRFFI